MISIRSFVSPFPRYTLDTQRSLPLYLPQFDARVLSTSDIGAYHAGGEKFGKFRVGEFVKSQLNSWVVTLPETNIAPENGWLEY